MTADRSEDVATARGANRIAALGKALDVLDAVRSAHAIPDLVALPGPQHLFAVRVAGA